MIKRLVITGATSLIGTALVDECIKNNIEVLAICGRNSVNINRITRHSLINIVECDISEYDYVNNNTGDYDALIHLAWASTQGDVARNNIGAQIDNVKYSVSAVDMAERLGCRVFIGAGSQAEYGRTDEILTENIHTNPETAYGMAKLCASSMTRLACEKKGIKHIWTRILSAYGPKYQPRTVLNYTILELLNGRRPQLSAGEQIWDFIYSEDVARALLALVTFGKEDNTYVIGSGNSDYLKNYLIKTRDILSEIEGHTMPELDLGVIPYGDSAVMHLECDISKLKEDTGFEVQVDFTTGIEKTIHWIKREWM